ncbi:ParA family protein, partial [Methylosinus sp. PW1]|uniref:ParA family protein n=1 Tax=Methylosinus sp. PW1 TaxID=107636 RepID=UPI0018DB253A
MTRIKNRRKFAFVHSCRKAHLQMLTLAITINKGGVGKTTLTKHIAAAATDAGLNVMILDMDTQQNATNWAKRRKNKHGRDLPVVKFITENDLTDEQRKAEQAGCDLLLIDTPPGRSSEAPAAVEAADFVLMPFWLESDAHDGVAKSAGLARRMGKPAIAILNFATPNSRSHEEAARSVMDALGVAMAPVVLHRYELYRLANPE